LLLRNKRAASRSSPGFFAAQRTLAENDRRQLVAANGWQGWHAKVLRDGADLKSQRNNARVFGWLLALGVMLATAKGWAQIEIGKNTSMSLTGDVGFGYNGEYGDAIGSSHSTLLSGDATLQGYYYNPRFLSYYVDPIYNRSQADSGQGSLTNASSLSAGVNLFSGSHFPGSISFGEGFNSSGTYGLGVTPGLATTGNSHSFGIGWAELIPGAPPVNIQYSQTASANSIFGTSQDDHTDAKNLNVFSNYKLAGWYMGAHFVDTWTSTELPAIITGDDETVTGDTNSKSFSVNANHKLPMRGSFGASYGWSDFTGEENGSSYSGGNQTLSATAAFAPTDRFTTQFQANYDSSLAGSIEQQLIGVGAITPQVDLGKSSYSIALSNSDNVVLTRSLSLGFNVGHVEQVVYGENISATHFSAIVDYRFLKPLWGTMVVYAGVNDQATEAGNTGAGLVAGANFSKQWSNFELDGSFGYSQDTQTVLATQVTSNYSYMVKAQRRLGRRVRWLGTFNGFHTGLGEVTGSSAHAESYGTNLVYKMYNVGATYGHTSGTVLLTANGLVAAPGTLAPVLTGNQSLLDTGSSYSFSFTCNPVRRLSFSTSYMRTINDNTAAVAGAAAADSASKVLLAFTTYQFRKMVFTAGYTDLTQSVSTSGLPQASYTNFYVGIQRWFKAF
jgi:hypothetical protein